jgi:hypothetical protein
VGVIAVATSVRRTFPAAPFIAPAAGDLDQRLGQVADAINRKADSTTVPTFEAVRFRATDGSTWQLRISPTGTLILDQVTP